MFYHIFDSSDKNRANVIAVQEEKSSQRKSIAEESHGIEPCTAAPAETKKERAPVPRPENFGLSNPQFTRVFAPPTTAASFSCSVSSL
jgi:hypothetical protein